MPSSRPPDQPRGDTPLENRQIRSGARLFTSLELFAADPEILIQHGDDTYRLRITRAGKLILNK